MVARAVTKKITDLPTYGLNNNTGNVLYSEDGIAYQYPITDLVLKNDLASAESSLGGSLVGLEQGGTVQDAIWYKSVEMFGAIGDGVTDDTAAIQAALTWLCTGSYRTLTTSSGKKYRTIAGLTATFQDYVIGCKLIMSGPLVPETYVTNALVIYNAVSSHFELAVVGAGAENVESLPDYSAADPDGCVQAFVIDNSRNNYISVWGFGFAGRVLRTQSTGDLKTSNNIYKFRTGDTASAVGTGNCGQACYLQGGSDAFGIIEASRTAWDIYGSVLDRIADVTITSWEADGGNYGPAMTFTQVGSGHIGTLSLGSQNREYPVFLFQDYGTSAPASKVHIERIFTVNGSIGIQVLGTTSGNTQRVPLHISSAFTYYQPIGVEFNNISNVEIENLVTDSTTNHSVYFDGTCRNIRINGGFLMNPSVDAIKTAPTADINYCYFTLRARSAVSGISLVDLSEGTVGSLTFRDCYFNADNGYVFNCQSGNTIKVIGGNYTGGTSFYKNNRPESISETSYPIVKRRGSSNFASGSTNGSTVTITHGLNITPTDIDLRWVGIPASGAQLILTDTTATTFTVTLSTSTALSAQVNFRWFANANLV